ncbi:MAG: SUMF1/EgtB/PvdO family nonheme iron enzyme, partial [Planctomycetota bacterium]
EEALGLAYAERAAARAPEDPGILDTLAWARFATGRCAGAREASERALEVADEEKREEYEGYLEKLQGEIAGVTGPEGARRLDEQIAGLEGKVAALQEEVSQPRTWRFAGTEDEWQHNVLAELAGKLKSFGDPEAGIIHDVEGRLELARGIEERSITGPEARAAWARAIASISDRKECPLYEGLLIKPQLGFLPLGRNQRTELWEFWHMQTGERPEPNPEWPESAVNRWIITEKTGLVFVLIPGGTFRMGVEPPRLGAGAEETAEGLRVTAVQDGSLASALELEVGDVLRSLKGSAIDSPEALRAVVRTLRAGERVECTLLRGGSELALSAGVERGIGSPNIDPAARRNESPIHEVTLDPFFLAKYEMTQGQWLRFVGENPSYYGKGFNAAGHVIDLSHAVERVSWTMCDETLRHLGLVLPTEAQWEYGCRAGTTTVYWSGDGVSNLQGVANIADRSAKRAAPSWNCEMDLDDGFVLHAPVGSFGSNHFGLHDTHGGVWEWCRDGYGAYALPIAEGAGERQVEGPRGRVNRGGSFRGPAVLARSAGRSDDAPGLRYDSLGLRPASGITD